MSVDLYAAMEILSRTHLCAISRGERANGVHLQSGPGLGKSEMVRQMCELEAAALKEPVGLLVFMMATISSVDVRGFMLPAKNAQGELVTNFSLPPWFPTPANIEVVEPDGTWHAVGTWKGPVPRVGVLFLDEFSQADEDVKKPAAELIYRGTVGTVELPTDWRVLSAGNRTSDRSGAVRELMFIVNRRCMLEIEPSLPAWRRWANARKPEERPSYLTMSFAEKSPEIVFRDTVPDGTDPYCTPRSLCLMDADLKALRTPAEVAADRLPMGALAREVAAGWIGQGSAAQFFAHLKYADELPDISDIVASPERAKLPETRDAQMVCGYMLAHHIDSKTARPMLAYIQRLNIEMQMLAVRAISGQAQRLAAVTSLPEFTTWLKNNKDLLIASQS